jgi:hypothetical protein
MTKQKQDLDIFATQYPQDEAGWWQHHDVFQRQVLGD